MLHGSHRSLDESDQRYKVVPPLVNFIPVVTVMRLLPCIIFAVTVLACAGNRSSTPRVEPPQLLTQSRPDLRTPAGPPRQGVVLDITLEVMIDAAGQPDFTTMRLTGLGASENRDAVVSWLQNARFRPGRQAGIPVAAPYRNGWRAETRVIRSPNDGAGT